MAGLLVRGAMGEKAEDREMHPRHESHRMAFAACGRLIVVSEGAECQSVYQAMR
jgi:hypothetical protein